MLTVRKPSEIKDTDTIVAVLSVNFFGHRSLESCYSLRFWDDGFGRLYAYRETLGILGVVRAQTWDTAWECAVDEIMDDAECTCPQKWSGHGEPTRDETRPDEDCPFHNGAENLSEGCTYRGSGTPSSPWAQTHIAQEDLNGAALDPLPDSEDNDTHYFAIVDDNDIEEETEA